MIDGYPAPHWNIFRIGRKIRFVDWMKLGLQRSWWWTHHAVIDCTWGLITSISLDIYQCLHILFQDIRVLLWPRSCRAIIEFIDWLWWRYLHVSFSRLHWILQGWGGVFSLHRVRFGLNSWLFILLATFSSFVFEPDLQKERLICMSVNKRYNKTLKPLRSSSSTIVSRFFHEIKCSILLLCSDSIQTFTKMVPFVTTVNLSTVK